MSNLKDRYAILKKRAHEKAARKRGTGPFPTNIRNTENSSPKPTIVKKKEKETEVLAVVRKGRGRRSKYTEEERKRRHQERLKKNREAAQQSRNKKKKQMEDLEDKVKILTDENSMLKARIEELSTSNDHLKILEENRDLRRRIETLEALVKEKLEQPPVQQQQQPQPISILAQQQQQQQPPTSQQSQKLVQNKSNFHAEGAEGSQQKETSPPPPPPPPPQESIELKMTPPPAEAQSQEPLQQLPLPSPPLLVTRALRGATPEQGKHTITMKTKKRRRQQQLTGGEALYEMFAGASELRKNETAAFNFCKPLVLRSSDAPVSSVMTLFLVQFLTLLFASMINPKEFGISLRPLNRHFWIQLCQVMTRYPNSLIHVWRKKELHSQNMMDIIKTLSLRDPRNHELLTTSNKLASFVVQSLSCAKEYIKSGGRRRVKRRKRRWGMHVFVG